jgi:hypothetical protein
MEGVMEMGMIAFFFLWNLIYGSPIHVQYPLAFVTLYPHPIWRLLLCLFTVAAIAYSPRVGIMVSFALFFYLMDMNQFTKPWNSR